jgi:5-methylcytosine-specific restriction enzyme subunit McrC
MLKHDSPIELVEYGAFPEPVPLSPQVAQTIHDHMQRYLHIGPAWGTPGCYTLSARQYVGEILVGDMRIRIRSDKASMTNLFWMLTYAYDLAEFRDQTSEYFEEESLFEFLVAIWVGQVERLVRRGIHRSYRNRQDNRPRLRGKLDIAQQIRRNLVHPERFAVEWADHTSDLLENRLLKHVLLRLAGVHYVHNARLGLRLRRAYSAFDRVQYTPIASRDFEQVRYDRLNQHYRGPLALARLLWQHLSVRNESGQVPFATFLFDLNVLFERFIAAYLKEALRGSGLQVRAKYRSPLDRDQLEDAEMDVVLLRHEDPVLVLDTKYKSYEGKPTRTDLTQIYTYCQTLQVRRGVILYPSAAHLDDQRRMIGVDVAVLGIGLGGSLERIQARLRGLTAHLLKMAERRAVNETLHIPAQNVSASFGD